MTDEKRLHNKIVYLVSGDNNLIQIIESIVKRSGGAFFHGLHSKETAADVVAKNPSLVVYDEHEAALEADAIIHLIKIGRPNMPILLLTEHEQPQRSIDTSGLGVSYQIRRDSHENKILDAIEHSMGPVA